MSTKKKGILGILSLLIAVSIALLCTGLPALGHEARDIGSYAFEVGFIQEPTFRSFPNGVDIFITRKSDDRPINKQKGDTVDLTVEVQLRDREASDSRILQSAKLDPLKQAFGVENEYNSWFLPTVVGPYAFHITGTVSDDSDPKAGQQQIDVTFICGKGSLDSDTAFDCVKAPLLFPSGQ